MFEARPLTFRDKMSTASIDARPVDVDPWDACIERRVFNDAGPYAGAVGHRVAHHTDAFFVGSADGVFAATGLVTCLLTHPIYRCVALRAGVTKCSCVSVITDALSDSTTRGAGTVLSAVDAGLITAR